MIKESSSETMHFLRHLLRIPATPAGLSPCRRLSASPSAHNHKLYEYRRYAVQPSKMRDCMAVMEEIVPVRTQHSKLTGAWCTELGGLNEVNFLWEYDDYTHRTTVRKTLAQNDQWQNECLPKLLPLLVSQTNMLWKPFPTYPAHLHPAKGYGVYTMFQFDLKPGMLEQYFHVTAESLRNMRQDVNYPRPIGVWYSEFGPFQSVFYMFRYASFEEREEFWKVLGQSPDLIEWRQTIAESEKLASVSTARAMVPTSFSPLK